MVTHYAMRDMDLHDMDFKKAYVPTIFSKTCEAQVKNLTTRINRFYHDDEY